ncbi:MAG: hypothetical protein RBR68_14250 [Tenuifilaceae bacterium]|jgi:hypothetical protein|nr:hypothetical protein [Tenuifilaceae bacterium]
MGEEVSFNSLNNISDIYKQLSSITSTLAQITKSRVNEFQFSLAYVIEHDDVYSNYTLSLQREGALIYNALLMFEPAFYDLNGYPEVGDYVYILHQNNKFNIFILSRCNTPAKVMVGSNYNGVAAGVLMP